jgi:hypothetical protein
VTEPPVFLTRGVVLVTRDIETLDWPTRAKAAGLTTIATHNHTTLKPPTQIRPEPGIFLEFAPIARRYDRPLSDRAAQRLSTDMTHGEHLDCLDANLAVFGTEGAQVLEYWMDNSRFSGWKRDQVKLLPWNREVFLADIELYAARGIRHVTQFATWLDGWYVEHFGEPPVDEYGAGLLTHPARQ